MKPATPRPHLAPLKTPRATPRAWPLPTAPSSARLPTLLAVLLISLVWPALDSARYMAWRTPALAFLQLFLFALPFTFSTAVFDVIAPRPGVGPLAWVYNCFQLAMSEVARRSLVVGAEARGEQLRRAKAAP